MKFIYRYGSLLLLTVILLAGCGGDGSSNRRGALDAGGRGLAINQVDDGTGTTVPANFSAAMDINDSLEVIGFAEVAAGSPFVAALWTVDVSGAASVAPTALASLTPGGFAAAFAIDQGGSPVGQAYNGNRLVAVIWKNGLGAPAVLPQMAATGSYAAYAISDDGSLIVGEAADGSGATRAVIWAADGNGNFANPPVPLPVNIFASGADLSRFSSANGVTRIGATEILVVGEAEAGNGTMHGALWRSIDGGASFAPKDLGAGHIALAVNASRQVVGESVASLSPVAWTVNAQGVASAPVALATAGSAVAINDNGRIAGWSGASDRATVWNGTTPLTLFDTESRAYALNNDVRPLIVGRNGSQGFVKRAD